MAGPNIRATDGSLNIAVVSGAARTGIQDASGNVNVVVSDGLSVKGAHHPCGAWWVTASPAGYHGIKAPDGSLYVSVSPYTTIGQRVTVVSGSL